MTPEEQRKLEEEQIKKDFSALEQELSGLQREVSDKDKTEAFSEITRQFNGLQEKINQISKDTDLNKLKKELEEIRKELENFKQSIRGDASDLQEQIIEESKDKTNERTPTPPTCELLIGSETHNRLLNIISSNPKKFENIQGTTPEAKLEYIFTEIRKSIVLFMKNKLGNSENIDKIIDNTIAPAFEWSLMELLRDQGNENNIAMLNRINKISFKNFGRMLHGVGKFVKKAAGYYAKTNQWMNAIDYLSVHNGALNNPEKSAVLTNPIEFKNYLNNPVFAKGDFSPYTTIDKNIFKLDENQTFKFGILPSEKQSILSQIGDIQVVNNPKTTALIAKFVNKPVKFFESVSGLQQTANRLLDGVNSLNSVTKIFGVDILGEISKFGEKSLGFKALDFVCKLIGITGGLDGVVKKWRLYRMDLSNEKNRNIGQIFKEYKEKAGEGTDISIIDSSSCSSALTDFDLTELDKASTTKGDHLRDAIADKININWLSPAMVQQTLGNNYLKREIVDGEQQEQITVDLDKIRAEKKEKELVHTHLQNMRTHLESNYDSLKDFYANIHNTDDIVLCTIASLYVDKNDVIEGVKAKVFLPENYGVVYPDGIVQSPGNDSKQESGSEPAKPSGEVSEYKLSEGPYPFKDVPPYKGIATYDLRNVKITPVLDYSELTKKHEGVVTLKGSNIKNKGADYPPTDTKGNKSNNPCDISHSDSDIGYRGKTTVRDGQDLAIYDTPVNGIASAMRLLKRKYSNKSITEINVGGYQRYYEPNEEIGLSALRIKWITEQCNALGVGPHEMLNFDDPMTLKSFVAQIAILETGTNIGMKLLDSAYQIAFPENN